MPKFKDFEDYDDFEMEEIENDYGINFSQMASKMMKSKPKKNHKEPKFKKDGYYDKNRK